jgi:hypothetical protein
MRQQCPEQFQFKNKLLDCEFERGHTGPHFNDDYGCWPNTHGRPKNMNEMVNRTVLLVGLCLAAGALFALIWWLVASR